VHLVASSIPELNADAVTVVDQAGHLLSATRSSESAAASEQLEATQRIEASYVQRIEQLLQPLVGAGNVRAQVAVDLESSEVEQTHEQFAPNSAVVRSEQLAEASSSQAGGAGGGVPGSLSNQPPAGGTVAPATNPATAGAKTTAPVSGVAAVTTESAASNGNSSRQSTRNFEIDRTLSYSKQPGGRIKRVTAAVLLDNVRRTGADGKETAEPLAAAQIEDITKLVKNAVGFDETRGDNVSVVNAAFRVDAATLIPEVVPLWQRSWVQESARLALGALVLLALALGVLRPLVRNLTMPTVVPVGALAGGGAGAAGAAEGAAVITAAGAQPLAYEQQLVQAKNLVAQDPKRVAQVVKSWVGEK
jgi:flagellar M-ring protein FliF